MFNYLFTPSRTDITPWDGVIPAQNQNFLTYVKPPIELKVHSYKNMPVSYIATKNILNTNLGIGNPVENMNLSHVLSQNAFYEPC